MIPMGSIVFRSASVADAALLTATRQKVWCATYRGIYPDEALDAFDYEWHENKERTRLENPDFQCFLVLDGDTCVGYFSYGSVKAGQWKDFSFRLHSLYLLPAYQGMGLGRRIFELVREHCLAMGYEKMYLDCHPDNHRALKFYRHMGGVIACVDGGHDHPMADSCTIEYDFTKD